MIRNYFLLGMRHIFRHRGYVLINILGLAVGLACFMLIGLFVWSELSYDRYNEKCERIYNLVLDGKIGEQTVKASFTSSVMAPTFREEVPEIREFVRMDSWNNVVVRIDDRSYVEDKFLLADSTFFNIFSIPLIRGDAASVLAAPHKVVLTQTAAGQYFPEEDPMGKLIYVGNDPEPFEVTGICEDVPALSHFDFNLLASFVSMRRANEDDWFSNSYPAYVLLAEGADKELVEEKIMESIIRHIGPQIERLMGITLDQFAQSGGRYGIVLQPLADIHLNPEIQSGFKPANDRKYVYIFSLVALLIISIAIINYMNLSTARSAGRAFEVGIRKVLGSSRFKLVGQFLVESFLLTCIAMITAVLLVEMLMPLFNNLIHTRLRMPYFDYWFVIPGLFLLTVFVGIVSGSYPAFFLSSFKPLSVLSGNPGRRAGSGTLRSILVVFQMLISITIILGTVVIYHQISYMLNKDLGFDKEQLLVVRNLGSLRKGIPVFRDEVSKIPGVLNCSHSTAVPGHVNNVNSYMLEGKTNEDLTLMTTAWADPYQLNTYGFELVEGRYLREDMPSDSTAVVINESAVRQFAIKDPLQTSFYQPRDDGGRDVLHVVGVVKDFHFASLHEQVQPHVFRLPGGNQHWGYLTLKISGEDYQSVVRELEKIWKEFTNNMPLQYFFMDEDFDNLYREERRTGSLSLAFAILAVFIASLGLYGLSSFTAEQRTREIGIRKSQGASSASILILLGKEVALLIGLATLMAWPLGYLFLKNWLNNFAYRIALNPLEFVLSLLLVLVLSWITISYRSFRAARINPATALRHQ